MNHWKLPLAAALAVMGLQACDISVREAPRTTVNAPAQPAPAETSQAPVAADPAAATTPVTSGDGTAAATPPADGSPASPPADAAVAGGAAQPDTAAMGAQSAVPATAAATPEGVAAPTELSLFFDEMEQRKAKNDAGPASTDANRQGKRNEKVSALPAVRNPGDPEGARLLAQRALEVPVAGVQPASLSDQFDLSRGSRRHEAIDILAPSGTPVVAVDDGRIAKLFTSKAGGLTIYQFDAQSRLAYYYAHLQRYANTVREGMDVRRGDLIGYVGSSGNADGNTPHLHFAVFRLGDPPKWWQGEAVNPYPALARAEPADRGAGR